jgi:hypothetical protein
MRADRPPAAVDGPPALRFRRAAAGNTPGVRTVYITYWLIIACGLVVWIAVGLTVE